MRQPGKHEIDVMVLRLKFAGRFGDVGGHHFFPCGLMKPRIAAGFSEDRPAIRRWHF